MSADNLSRLSFVRRHPERRRRQTKANFSPGEGLHWTTSTSAEFHSPDIADVDVEVLAHWISRSEHAKYPVLRARISDLAWEIGRYLKLSPKADEAQAKGPASIDIPFLLAHRAIDADLETAILEVLKSRTTE